MKRTLFALIVCGSVGAAAADCPAPGQDTKPVAVHVVKDATGTRIVIDTPIDICGRPPTPQVAYLAPPLQLDYQWSEVKLDFLPLIMKSVRQTPFEARP